MASRDKSLTYYVLCSVFLLWFALLITCFALLFVYVYEFKPSNSANLGTNVSLVSTLVETKSGKIRGQLMEGYNNKTVYTYLGVPFATPPVGALRFRRTVPVAPWDGVYEAREWAPQCMQSLPRFGQIIMKPASKNMSEDCLYLNIWTPSLNKSDLKPVLFWIHGGGFQFGSASQEETDGRTVSTFGDVVVVAANYRVNAFGFLNLQTEEVGGNMGLYDQAMAMQWVKDNIAQFGGDPDQITLWGESAGAMSIVAHLVSPFTKKLFKRAIIESGSLFLLEVMYSQYDQVAGKFLTQLGCSSNETEVEEDVKAGVVYVEEEGGEEEEEEEEKDTDMRDKRAMDCIMKASAENIIKVVEKMNLLNPISFVISPYEAFINFTTPKEVKDNLFEFVDRSGELLMGFNSDEGSLILNAMLPDKFPEHSEPQIESVDEARAILSDLFQTRFNVPKALIETAVLSYLPLGLNTSREMTKGIYDFIGHNVFVCPVIALADEISRVGLNVTTYMYHFSQRTSYSENLDDWFGVTHYEEVPFVFGYPLRAPNQFTKSELQFSTSLMKSWINFAKTGKPSSPSGGNWPPYSLHDPLYMEIKSNNQSSVGSAIYEKSCSLFKLALDSW